MGQGGTDIFPLGLCSFICVLQQILDSFIIFVAQQTAADIGTVNIEMPVLHRVSTSSLKIPWTQYSPSHIRIVPFLTREYSDDEFQSIVKTVMGNIEQKIREGLCMMGLKDEVFHISWLLIYSLQFAISAAIITVSAMSSLFKYSDKSLVIFIILASLLLPTALALGSINFADYDRAHVGLRWSNMWRASSGVNFLLCLLMMVFDSLLYCALGLYCDKESSFASVSSCNILAGSRSCTNSSESFCNSFLLQVLRGENGTRNLWNYLFQKGSLKTKSTKANQSPKPEVSIRDNLLKDQLIPYCVHTSETSVESISLEMKQQELDGRYTYLI
ncbi:hypothetical protein QQ045_010798 [Rhodiola kirilowii]